MPLKIPDYHFRIRIDFKFLAAAVALVGSSSWIVQPFTLFFTAIWTLDFDNFTDHLSDCFHDCHKYFVYQKLLESLELGHTYNAQLRQALLAYIVPIAVIHFPN